MTQNRDVGDSPRKFESSSPHHSSIAEGRLNGTRGAIETESGPNRPGYSGDTRKPETRSKFDSSRPLSERWARLTKPAGDCIVWTGTLDADGYGRLFVRGRRWRAHRLAWELERGPIPDGQVVMHRCDRPSCVRIEHLELGTQAENLRDRDRKRRTVVPVRRAGAWTGKHRRAG